MFVSIGGKPIYLWRAVAAPIFDGNTGELIRLASRRN
jgi:hypothetical protein